MEQVTDYPLPQIIRPDENPRDLDEMDSSTKAFIEANTVSVDFEEIRHNHIIPVFVKDNEPLISHAEFIEAMLETTKSTFQGETILRPSIRLSHPIKGRIPEAKDKPASELLEHEKTLYYERMAFVIDIPTIHTNIDGNPLSLSVGGVKSYNLDNLYARKGSDEHFKVFIGFKNRVCTNLCVWTDGYQNDLKVRSNSQLIGSIRSLMDGYNQNFHLHQLNQLTEHSITEQQFAQLVGRCRMYTHLPTELKTEITPLLFGDQQIGAVVKDFYRDISFCRDKEGKISLWRLYNLFTGANKTTYIDNFLDRSVNAYNLVEQIRWGLEGKKNCWYLS